ncbi:MBOAT family O-acyltransferase [Saliterribacillus persicus]|uniref:Alginate O-acetyltransferase complex protein AlgI n=1 Tax=Saliterribacillus persicus TaxID=930114 RepID=A0A368YCK2_9BACI|nr:MBOAT family O-acyltransferase [Saliterribacillus persicus]RCW77399.1 alginate O-acetyltransferase complex protein AlgI [Saliterribacillus persicus]
MLFNSVPFIFLFLPIVFIGYFVIIKSAPSKKASIIWLVISSLFFYAFWNPMYIFLILSSIFVNYNIAKIFHANIDGKYKKIGVIAGVIFNVALLGYFKYVDFFIKNINGIFETDFALLYIMLPLAISFFTFQQIAFLVDNYRGEYEKNTFSSYALFVSFFPQLIAGPIVHHREMMPQFEDENNKNININNISKGLFIFIIGLTKKVGIADTVAIWANTGFQNYESLSTIDAWITSFSYTLQLYFDFSGYCDMAIGIALLFNIKLPINFLSPYKARNIQDFWKRWHITLSRFLTSYIYIPLGGNRKGEIRTYINIFIVFLISGFWHGAGWTFVLWGIFHGIASMAVRLWGIIGFKLPYWFSWIITFMFVNITWVYFRATSIEQANTIISKMFQFNYNYNYPLSSFFQKPLKIFEAAGQYDFILFKLDNPKIIVFTIITLLIITFITKNSIQLLDRFRTNIKTLLFSQVLLIGLVIIIFFIHKNSEFLYFNF